jgi:hypothetical protein
MASPVSDENMKNIPIKERFISPYAAIAVPTATSITDMII